MRIAVVDDIKEERTLLHGWLYSQLSRRNVSADIVEFESGEEFLLAAKERPFTVLFLDIYMGGANGIEIAKDRCGLSSDLYHHIHRPCTGRIQGTGTALSCKAV